MDWDLWGPSYYQAAPESSCCSQSGCWHDADFVYGFDVVEENAVNEKSCVQVLQILLANADSEIDELEKDLVALQNQLAWSECEEWSEICCTAFREKIDCLNISIKSLRDEDEHDTNMLLVIHREPAETIHEILKVLLKKICQENNEQPLDAIVKDSSSEALEHATDSLNKKKKLCIGCNVVKEEIEEICAVLDSSLTLMREKIDHPVTVKAVIVSGPNIVASRYATGHSNGKRTKNNSDLRNIGVEVEENNHVPTTENTTSESGEKNTNLGGNDKERPLVVKKALGKTTWKPANTTVKGLSSNDLRCASAIFKEAKNMSKSDSIMIGKEEVGEKNSSRAERSMILHSSLKSASKGGSRTYKPANTFSKDLNSDDLRHATTVFKENKNLGKYDLKVTGKEDIKEQNSTPTDKSIILLSPSKSAWKGSNGTDEPANTISKSLCSDDLRQSTAFFSENKKLCKSVIKVNRKEEVKEKLSTPMYKSMIVCSPPKFARKGRNVTDKPAKTISKSSNSNDLRHATASSSENKKLRKSDSNVNGKEEVREKTSTPMDKGMIVYTTSKFARKGRNVTDKSANTISKNLSSDDLRRATAFFSESKKLRKFDSKVKVDGKEETKEKNSSLMEKSMIVYSPPKFARKGRNVTDKPTDNTGKGLCSDDLRHATSIFRDHKSSCKSGLKVNVKEDIREENSICTDRSIVLYSPSNSALEGKNEPDKPANIMSKGFSSDDPRHATGLYNENKNLSKSDSGIDKKVGLKTINSTHVDIHMISYSPSKSARKRKFGSDKEQPANTMNRSLSSDGTRHNKWRKSDSQVDRQDKVREQNSTPTRMDKSIVVYSATKKGRNGSDKHARCYSSDHPRLATGSFNENKSLCKLKEVKEQNSTWTDRSIVLYSPSKSARNGRNETEKPSKAIVQGSSSDALGRATGLYVEKEYNSSGSRLDAASVPKPKKAKGSGIRNDTISLLESFLNGTIGKESDFQDLRKGKKRKVSSDWPQIVTEVRDLIYPKKLAISLMNSTESSSVEANAVTYTKDDDSSNYLAHALVPASSSRHINLSNLTLVDLRAIAKHCNMKNYSKTRKGDLIEQLYNQLDKLR